MSKKKPIEIFEEHLDKLATTTVEKDIDREVEEIYKVMFGSGDALKDLIKVLVSKGIVSLKDFKRVLGE